jgi:hypothetical protein
MAITEPQLEWRYSPAQRGGKWGLDVLKSEKECRVAAEDTRANKRARNELAGGGGVMTPLISALLSLLVGLLSLLAIVWVVMHFQRRVNNRSGLVPSSESLEFVPWWSVREPFMVLRVSDAFDPEFAMLWDTQIPALTFISQAGADGVSMQQLAPLHRLAAIRNPELFDGSGFEEWLRFLEGCELVSRKADRVYMTAAGREFMAGCLRNGGGRERHAKAA